ncbi:DnaJ-domain-containing protein [Fragilariopsis cylindrus CCMP1102]|uniref:DnaJ-domain-containing protein n=1 Tax=Fragilariopsis cylindrus CCMP1102 TaxID=635003 RepID=A0A1E7FDT6_9STRA|nr:DnaJ-domain-containing protein [Fragilariopsis cylindrus CCMP1102]|eukprot:OEU16342.1 DnaJ-domain-containing protein [Fragilariopsis cylindrus CCMP1102]
MVNEKEEQQDQKKSGSKIQCHYEILCVERDADASTIKKAHRKQALKYHPDKNFGDEQASNTFLLVQQAYEVLSATYMQANCYSGYHNEKGGFYQVYTDVFESIVACELKQSERSINLPSKFGNIDTDWEDVNLFYRSWDSFSSALNFAWEDKYNSREDGESRRIRRLMDEENNKARKAAKKTYNNDIMQLVAFVKRRDPRVKSKLKEQEKMKKEREAKQKVDKIERKKDRQQATEAWREASMQDMEEAEENDRMRGRIRLADLDDDYDYGLGKKGKGKKKNRYIIEYDEEEEDTELIEQIVTSTDQEGEEVKTECIPVPVDGSSEQENDEKQTDETLADQDQDDQQHIIMEDPLLVETDIIQDDEDDDYIDDADSTESEESEEPDIWRCECCRKDFKSEAQMENHMKSKKHKTALKKYEAKLKKREEEIMSDMLEDMAMNDEFFEKNQ